MLKNPNKLHLLQGRVHMLNNKRRIKEIVFNKENLKINNGKFWLWIRELNNCSGAFGNFMNMP